MDDSTGGGGASSASSSSYEHLLQQMGALQGELQKYSMALRAVTVEKDQLRGTYEAMKAELFKTKARYDSARKEALDALEAKIEGERNTEIYVQSWKAAYDTTLKAYEELQAKYAPQDLELLRIQVANELEGPHQAALAELRQEGEVHERGEAEARRQLAALQVTVEQVHKDFEKEVALLREERRRERAELRREKEALQAELEVQCAPKDDEIRVLGRSLHERKAELRAVKDELQEVRKREQAAEQAKAEAVIAQLDDVTQLQAQLAEARSAAAAAARRATNADEKLQQQKEAHALCREKLTQSETEAERLRNTLALKDQGASDSFGRREEEHQRLRHLLEVKLAAAGTALDAERERAQRSAQVAKEAVEGANQRQARLDLLEQEIRREHHQGLEQLQEEIERLEKQVAALESRAAAAEEEAKVSGQRLRRDLEMARAENARILREREAAVAKLATTEEAARRVRTELAELKREREEARLRAGQTSTELHGAQERENDLERQLEESEQRAAALEAEVQSLSRQQEERRLVHAGALRDLRAKGADELRTALERERTAMEQELKGLHESLRRERKRSAGYKAKALEAHRHLTQTRTMYAMTHQRGYDDDDKFEA